MSLTLIACKARGRSDLFSAGGTGSSSLVLKSTDGGASWSKLALSPDPSRFGSSFKFTGIAAPYSGIDVADAYAQVPIEVELASNGAGGHLLLSF